MTNPENELDRIDVPVVANREMAEDMLEDLEEEGRISVEIRTSQAPNIIDQIEWQLENDQQLLEITDDYSNDSE